MRTIALNHPDSAIQLHVNQKPHGAMTVSWTLQPEAIEQLQQQGFRHPHAMVVVSSQSAPDVDWQDKICDASQVFFVALDKSTTMTPQFSKSGSNIITLCVIDERSTADRRWMEKMTDDPCTLHVDSDGGIVLNKYQPPALDDQVTQTVVVPKEYFAPSPPRWLQEIVQMSFHTKVNDTRHPQLRILVSLLAQIPIQIYGVFTRLVTLLFAIFMGCRGMSMKTLFALDPHECGRKLGPSFWFFDSKGKRRHSLLFYVNPATIVIVPIISAVAFVIFMWPAALYASSQSGLSFRQGVVFSTIFYTSLAVISFVAMLCSPTFRTTLRDKLRSLSKRRRSVRNEVQIDDDFYGKLLHSDIVTESLAPANDPTVPLVVKATGSKVCRPFEQR